MTATRTFGSGAPALTRSAIRKTTCAGPTPQEKLITPSPRPHTPGNGNVEWGPVCYEILQSGRPTTRTWLLSGTCLGSGARVPRVTRRVPGGSWHPDGPRQHDRRLARDDRRARRDDWAGRDHDRQHDWRRHDRRDPARGRGRARAPARAAPPAPR